MYRVTENCGVSLRLNRIFNGKDKMFLLPLDHGVNLGYTPRLNIRKNAEIAISNGIDAIMIRPGMAKYLGDLSFGTTSIVMALTGKFDRRIDHQQINNVEYAIKNGADAVCTEFKFGSDNDLENALITSRVTEEAHCYGLPHLVTVYVLEQQIKKNGSKAYAHACRIAEELGADFIKTSLPKDSDIIKQCMDTVSVPIITAGGKKISDTELLEDVIYFIEHGVGGVAIGRNIWDKDNAEEISREVIKLIRKYSVTK